MSEKRPCFKDINNKISLEENVELLLNYGFKQGYKENIRGDSSSKELSEELMIFYHEGKGLILYVETGNNKSVIKQSEVYGEINAIFEELNYEQIQALGLVTFYDPNDVTISFSISIFVDILLTLEILLNEFEFCSKWPQIPFLYFLTSLEIKEDGSDYKELTAKRLAKCSNEIKEIIGVK